MGSLQKFAKEYEEKFFILAGMLLRCVASGRGPAAFTAFTYSWEGDGDVFRVFGCSKLDKTHSTHVSPRTVMYAAQVCKSIHISLQPTGWVDEMKNSQRIVWARAPLIITKVP